MNILIGEIQNKLPDPKVVVVNQLEFDLSRTSLQVTGNAKSRPDIGNFIKVLEASPLLGNVQDRTGTPIRSTLGSANTRHGSARFLVD